ncbi:MORC family CW-type zinc finger protein [Marchantia polymorpha subsp. ruderalis]|uniref:CW-type domain-containing protein n=1 Tax=Marchantia polymorpha TaxID=3197 RepID=A0A2R6XI21_MARPO|nr:hypothetical protein MARPO_0013s0006 [Marchantia polymorpha]BBN19872.1 hypothetical protein Mp_8g14420 [Marchantia polymorpha subsp. ruderalis]|eukprot:PTQ45739.1 hypothetical protein MARPO_0013s0006 [Marchantia polymorpha]
MTEVIHLSRQRKKSSERELRMSGVILDLNSLPDEGRPTVVYEYSGLLSKDGILVSPVAVIHLPISLPSNLNFSDFKPAAYYPLDNLPSFDLHPQNPSPNASIPDRRHEWLKFTSFLHARDKVIPIIVGEWELLIKPPKVRPTEKSPLRVCYRKLQKFRAPACEISPTPSPTVAPACEISPTPSPTVAPAPQPVSGSVHSIPAADVGRSSAEVLDPPENLRDNSKERRSLGQMHPSYLQTLAQLHASWQFGGLAELVDNARDAQATRLNISITTVKMKGKSDLMPLLRIEDNGRGMNHEEIVRMLQFGHKMANHKDHNHIGYFGVGFKSGSMRLGRDVIILTQSKDSRSIGFLSTSYNADKEILEVPIVTYRKVHGIMEMDLSVQTEEQGQACLQAVKTFSPFNEFEIGSFFDKIGEGKGNGTYILIYNLDRWGKEYALQWDDEDPTKYHTRRDRDITIRSKRVRARPSQTSKEIPLDYSLRSYLEVLFLDPRMIIRIQGSKVKTTRLAQSLNKTYRRKGNVCGKVIELTLGRSSVEYNRGNCGIFLYWHGRLIEAYKRVGGMVHSADVGRGVIGVIDVTTLMEDDHGTKVLNTKQSFEDCEEYAILEKWLGDIFNDYWYRYFDNLEVVSETNDGQAHFEPDREWVQCDKCRKWRKLPGGVHTSDLPEEWFCYMKPYAKTCSEPEEQAENDIVTVGVNRTNVPTPPVNRTSVPSPPINRTSVPTLVVESTSNPTTSSRIFPKSEPDVEDDDLSTPIGTLFKRQARRSVVGVAATTQVPAVRAPESPSPKQGNMSPIRKRLRKRK